MKKDKFTLNFINIQRKLTQIFEISVCKYFVTCLYDINVSFSKCQATGDKNGGSGGTVTRAFEEFPYRVFKDKTPQFNDETLILYEHITVKFQKFKSASIQLWKKLMILCVPTRFQREWKKSWISSPTINRLKSPRYRRPLR